MACSERRPVRVGSGRHALPETMTREQARRWGDRAMPGDLKRAGFQTCVFASDPAIHGDIFYRVSYGRAVNPRQTG